MKALFFGILALLALVTYKKAHPPQQNTFKQTPATTFNNLFTRYKAGTLTGSDINYSIPLPNGKECWMMGDTFTDSVTAQRVHTKPGLLSSTIFLSDGRGNTTPTYAGTLFNNSGSTKAPFYTPIDDSTRRWAKDGVYLNGHIYAAIFVNRGIPNTHGLGIKTVGTEWADISYPGFKVNKIYSGCNSSKIIFGSCVIIDAHYIYIYGAEPVKEKNNHFSYMHLARVKKTTPTAAWEYYSGDGTANAWSPDYNAAARLKTKTGDNTFSYFGGLPTEYTVFKNDGMYYLINESPLFFSDTVYRYRSASIFGPWKDRKAIALTTYPKGQTKGDGEYAYDAKAHPEFTNPNEPGDLLISNNTNNLDISKIINNADWYRPYFSWVPKSVWASN